MLNGAKVIIICILGGLAFANPGAAGSLDSSYAQQATDRSSAAEAGSRGASSFMIALSTASCNKTCNQQLDKCNKKPPYGNDRICASDYYDCMKKNKCKYDPNVQ